jgi:peroxiredoxin
MTDAKSFTTQLGITAPHFELPAIDGPTVALTDFVNAPALLVAFLCNHCPQVQYIEKELGRLTSGFSQAVLATVGICSSDVERQPEDGVAQLTEQAARASFNFPYLIDETQEVAKAYGALSTPDFFVYDRDRKLVYRGGIDGSTPDNDVPADGPALRAAVENVIFGEPVSVSQTPSEGCPIVWKPGNEPG